MRICFAGTFNFPEGGAAARAVYLQAKGLAERGHDVSILTCRGAWETGNTIMYNGLKVTCFLPTGFKSKVLPNLIVWMLSQLWILYRLLFLTLTLKSDLIMFYGCAPVFAPVIVLLKIFRCKSAYIQGDLMSIEHTPTLLSYLYRRLLLLSEKILASCATVQIIGGTSVLKERLRKLGNTTHQLCLWPPTDINSFAAGNGNLIKKQYNLFGKNVIVYTGSLTNLEGIHTLIDAMSKVLEVHYNAVLLLVGANSSIDPAHNGLVDYKQMVSDLKINKSVVFTGLVDMAKVPDYLASADVLVMPKIDHPANHVASPIKIGEYLASGRPVVSSKMCELDVWLTDRFDILFCKPGDSSDLADKICEVLDDVELASQLAENGIEAAKKNCDYRVWAQHVENTITNL